MKRRSALLTLVVTIVVLAPHGRPALAVPTAEQVVLSASRHIGAGVDGATGASLCVIGYPGECHEGRPGQAPGGFLYPSAVAVDQRTGELYVADAANNRVQEFSAAGVFLAMFGWEVNATKDAKPTATQAERNLCTAREVETLGVHCTAGKMGTAPDQFSGLTSIAVDPLSGSLYTQEATVGNFRVDEYTPEGRFVRMIGKDVNANSRGNICTETEIERSSVRCQAGQQSATAGHERAAFKFAAHDGDLLAVGGPEHLLYVGDEQRLQEFEADGRWKREVSLAWTSPASRGWVVALALAPDGSVYVVYEVLRSGGPPEPVDIVRELDPSGEQIGKLTVSPRQPDAALVLDGLALDRDGGLAAIGPEIGTSPLAHLGALYDGIGSRRISGFAAPSDNDGIGFGPGGELYVAATDRQEVVVYRPTSFAELVTSPSALESCSVCGASIAIKAE